MHLPKFQIFLLSFLLCLLQYSTAQNISTDQYIDDYKALAVAEMKRVGIPASITIAQGILESSNGNSYLATVGNNHFGVKCHNDWSGKKIYVDDDLPDECFRKYKSVYESFIDHSNFLTAKGRYSSLFNLDPLDYKNWAKGLKKAGYATDPQYANKLISLIERYQLQKFDLPGGIDCDNIVLDLPVVTYYNRIKTVIFTCDITIAQVAKAYRMDQRSIRKYNDFESDVIPANTKVYFQPKRGSGPFGLKKHIVSEGETMASISQLYGIKLKKLYKRNRMNMSKKEQPAAGQELRLRGKRSHPPILSTAPVTPKPKQPAQTDPPVFVPTTPSTDETDVSDFEIQPPVVQPPKTDTNTNTNGSDTTTTPSIDDTNTNTSTIITHTVKRGDTLYSISKKYSVSVANIKSANDMVNNTLSIGQKLIIKK